RVVEIPTIRIHHVVAELLILEAVIPEYNLSRHLKAVKNGGMLRTEKMGRRVFYCLINPPN
ncbi:MAG: hypothetical protein ACM3YE_15835, partial [Bacteroidota bacterium]